MSADNAEKSHKPTPKRQREFRKRGEIAMSRDLTATAALAGGAIGGILFWSSGRGALASFAERALRGADGVAQPDLASGAAHAFVVGVAPVFVGALVGCVVAGGLQLGWPPAIKRPSLDLGRIFGAASLGRIFSPKEAATRALIAAAKVLMVGGVVLLAVRRELDALEAGGGAEPATLQELLAGAVVRLALHAILALAVLAAVDFVIQRRRLGPKMKMSTDELKREIREQEGDPQVRGRRRRRMRELAQRRLVKQVKSADVVVVNPTEYAVALRYSAKDRAPRVTAKGRGQVASRIREIARQAGIPILRRPPLARLLHKLVPEGREIPVATYQAVAEILAYVYKLKARRT